jgi:hypothetical protein
VHQIYRTAKPTAIANHWVTTAGLWNFYLETAAIALAIHQTGFLAEDDPGLGVPLMSILKQPDSQEFGLSKFELGAGAFWQKFTRC